MLDGILDDILGSPVHGGEIRPFESFNMPEFSPDSPLSPSSNARTDDDRHFCHECLHLNSTGYCIQQRFRPVDDIPRRCEDFAGLPESEPRHSRFQITLQDGMPFTNKSVQFMSLKEIRIRYPNAASISPVIEVSL
ncbi:hypothetical protein [Methylomicrobium sp. Wu6]|uniref:hypothetical protein n=1 Tax=Methylomicrobium sp. Wu6 TaxID=3107928 RepID=UPI002DD69D48|nr:hypothetical protein [Methylomicrobium sp. Wu6]MEC4747172.1 hypothetical protein [Methylomicrobium sp. Wu6]